MRVLGRNAGFTLVEVLVVVTIIGLLTAIAIPTTGVALKKAAQTRETHAAKTLITAYLLAASEDQEGQLLAGMDFRVSRVWFEPKGKEITMAHVAHRYPFRLAPYFNYQLEGTILVNDNGSQIEKQASPSSAMYDYMVSAFPALGINSSYVGGRVMSDGTVQWGSECATRTVQAGGHSLLVFASGGNGTGSARIEGYNILTPPYLTGSNWSGDSWSEEVNPAQYGNVDGRYDGKAVCAFLDGSVQMLSIEDLRDMRLWSKNAADQDDPDYTIVQ